MTFKNPFLTHPSNEVLIGPRNERLLIAISNALVIFAIPIALLYGTILFVQFTWQLALAAILTIMLVPISLLTQSFGRRGKVEQGSLLLIISIVVVITLVSWLVKGLDIAVASPFIIAIILGGLLIGPRNSYLIAAVSAILWLITRFIMVSSSQHMTALPVSLESATVDLLVLSSFLFVAHMNQLAATDQTRFLKEATSDLLETNRRLEQNSRLKSQFTARTSHELRTPLSAIHVITELALRGAYGPLNSVQEDNLRRVLRNTKRLGTLIEDILDLSKIEAGQLEIIEEPFPVNSLIEIVHVTLDSAARAKDLQLRVSLSPDMPAEIVGDEQRIGQIVLNLANNAIKFTDRGEIEVQIGRLDTARWTIKVRDTGRGIQETDFENIFNEFYQEEPSFRGGQRQGTGLGLTITRHLVLLMGGNIHVTSEIGKGSTFEVALPLRLPPSE